MEGVQTLAKVITQISFTCKKWGKFMYVHVQKSERGLKLCKAYVYKSARTSISPALVTTDNTNHYTLKL